MIFLIIRNTKLVKIIKSLSSSAVTAKIPHLKLGFFCCVTYVIVAIRLVGAVLSITGSPISTFTSLCLTGALALPVIMLNRVKDDIHKCEALQKSESEAQITVS